MRAKKLSSNSTAAEARRLLAALIVIAGVLWGLNAVRAGAEDQKTEVAALPVDPEPLLGAGRTGMDKLISLDLRSTEATDALKYLAMQGELNISISNTVAGRVNLLLTNVPIRDVFDLILRSNELAYDKRNNVYHVMTEAEYRALYGRKFSDMRQVKTFRLKYASPQQAFNMLDTLKSDVGRLLVDEESGTVMVMEIPEKVREMEEALSVLEQEGTTKVIDLRYAKAKDIEEQLKDELEANKLGYVKADERSNQLVVKTLPDRMKQIEALIQALDRKTREVFIDAKIVKVAYTDSLDAGIDWDQVFSNLKFHGLDQLGPDKLGNFRNSTTGTAPTEAPAVSKLRLPAFGPDKNIKLGQLAFGTVARDGYELFRYLETVGRTRIISNPKLMVTENQEARILVGTREAYITTTTTSGQTTATTAEDVEFIDVGIQLAVTPTINQDGFVTMKIKPEISSVVRTLTTPSNNKIPIVDTSTAETTVMVADGTSVIIGGLRKNEKQTNEEKIPYLGNIPVIGKIFFKQTARDDQLTELVVFITPHIVGGTELVTGDEEKGTNGLKPLRDYHPIRGDSR